MEKWASHLYNNCYCYNRNGVIYTYVNHKRQSTGLKWNKENKERALEILHDRYNNYNVYEMRVSGLYNRYMDFKSARVGHVRMQQYKLAIKLIDIDFYVTEHILITRNIESNLTKYNDLASQTYNNRLKSLKSIFNYGIECGFLTVNPVKPYLMKKHEHKKVPSFTEYELNILLDYFGGSEMYRLIKFISLTGLRISEVLSIRNEDIFEDHFVIHGKGNRKRNFPLKAIPEVKEFLAPFDFSFNSAQYKFRNALKELDLYKRDRSFHGLRKFAINTYIQKGITPMIASEIFGHSIKIMEKYYIDIIGAEKLNEITENQLKSYTPKNELK